MSNSHWADDSLSGPTLSRKGMWSLEVMLRRSEHWLFGLSFQRMHTYSDAMNVRYLTGGWLWADMAYGEQLGLDQHVWMLGPAVAFEPWTFHRRHWAGMTVHLGAALQYVHFREQRYLIRDGSVDLGGSVMGVSPDSYDHDNMEVLGSTAHNSIAFQWWARGELHFGRNVSLFLDLGIVVAPEVEAEGSSCTTGEGVELAILPHRFNLSGSMLRGGLAVHF